MDMTTLVDNLKRHFGLGSNPAVRLTLYRRIAECVAQDDTKRAERIVATVIADAAGKDDPGRYFASVSLKRLEERGFCLRPQADLSSVFSGMSAAPYVGG